MSSPKVCGIHSPCSPLLFTLQKLHMIKGGSTMVCTGDSLKLARLLLHISDMCFGLLEDRVKQATEVRVWS